MLFAIVIAVLFVDPVRTAETKYVVVFGAVLASFLMLTPSAARVWVWQTSVLALVIAIRLDEWSRGTPWLIRDLEFLYRVWAIASVVACPALVWAYWKRAKASQRYPVNVFLAGLAFSLVAGSISMNPFVVAGCGLVWTGVWAAWAAWGYWREKTARTKRLATVTLCVFLGLLAGSAGTALLWKQRVFELAVRYGHTWVAYSLVRFGADVNAAGSGGVTALMQAAWKGDPDMVRALLSVGADIHASAVNGRAALSFAAESGNGEACAALLEAGANVNRKDVYGRTPLLTALRNSRSTGCASVLRKYGGIANGEPESEDTHRGLPPK